MSELKGFIMSEWSKIIFSAGLGMAVTFAGSYTAIHVKNAELDARLNAVEVKTNVNASEINDLKPVVNSNTGRIDNFSSLQSDIKELSRGINQLNTLLATATADVKHNTRRLDEIERFIRDSKAR